jgi:heme-degrading monooxygenase HmoA
VSERTWHLAQVNIATLAAPLDSSQLADFVAWLEPINALADSAPGFVWRLQTEDGDATAVRAYDDDRIIVNLSVWESLEALGDFVYRSRHADALRRRREWFETMRSSHLAMWWIRADAIPTVGEAVRRLQLLETRGASVDAFTFREPFAAPDAFTPAEADDGWLCPTP